MSLHEIDGITRYKRSLRIIRLDQYGIIRQNEIIVIQLEISIFSYRMFSIREFKTQFCLPLLVIYQIKQFLAKFQCIILELK